MGYLSRAITMLCRVLGLNGTFPSEMNAGEAFQLLADFPASPGFNTLMNGFSTLPNAFVDHIDGKHIHLVTPFDRVVTADDGYRITYTYDGEIRVYKAWLGTPPNVPPVSLGQSLFAAAEYQAWLDGQDQEPASIGARIWSGSTVSGFPPEQQIGFGVHHWGLNANGERSLTQ